jgi:hypothetical protein
VDIPSLDAFVLLLYLLPGFLATQLYRAKYPAKRVSQFEVVVWSVLHSFIIHLLLGLVGWLFDQADLNLLTRDSNSGIEAQTIAVLLAGGFIWGLALMGFHWLRIKVPILPNPDPQAIWPLVAGDIAKEQLWAIARTKEGTKYLGWIKRYSFDPEAEDHELLLCPAFVVDAKLEIQRDLSKGGVYLNTRDLDSLERVPGGKGVNQS